MVGKFGKNKPDAEVHFNLWERIIEAYVEQHERWIGE